MTTVTYTLPAYWASYLINGDASGIDEDDKAAADAFIAKHNLPGPVSCSEESWFARSNDASRLGGDVLEYTFLLPEQTEAQRSAAWRNVCNL